MLVGHFFFTINVQSGQVIAQVIECCSNDVFL